MWDTDVKRYTTLKKKEVVPEEEKETRREREEKKKEFFREKRDLERLTEIWVSTSFSTVIFTTLRAYGRLVESSGSKILSSAIFTRSYIVSCVHKYIFLTPLYLHIFY